MLGWCSRCISRNSASIVCFSWGLTESPKPTILTATCIPLVCNIPSQTVPKAPFPSILTRCHARGPSEVNHFSSIVDLNSSRVLWDISFVGLLLGPVEVPLRRREAVKSPERTARSSKHPAWQASTELLPHSLGCRLIPIRAVKSGQLLSMGIVWSARTKVKKSLYAFMRCSCCFCLPANQLNIPLESTSGGGFFPPAFALVASAWYAFTISWCRLDTAHRGVSLFLETLRMYESSPSPRSCTSSTNTCRSHGFGTKPNLWKAPVAVAPGGAAWIMGLKISSDLPERRETHPVSGVGSPPAFFRCAMRARRPLIMTTSTSVPCTRSSTFSESSSSVARTTAPILPTHSYHP
eukprot:Hpha_TRINITY_DN15805_c1_g5::TRINITY_DN15805_c1_g5_i6::g.190226::m.190226